MNEYEYIDADGDVFEAHVHNTANGERVLRLTCATAYPGPREVTVHVALHDAPDFIESLQGIYDTAAAKPGQVDALALMHFKIECQRTELEDLRNQVRRLKAVIREISE